MSTETSTQALIRRARALLAARQPAAAEKLLLQALGQHRDDPDLLEVTAEFYIEMRRPADSVRLLTRCIEVAPHRASAYFRLAELLEAGGRKAECAAILTRLTVAQPDLAIAHFNRAVYLRRARHLDDAVSAYRRAIELNVERAAEAWCNIGVICGELERHDDARAAFAEALAIDPRWIPALYNLALLHEEFGEREAALDLFRRVLEIDPDCHPALARIVHAQTIDDPADPNVERVRAALNRSDLAPAARESLQFALGKALDDCGRCDEAFAAFSAANTIARTRVGPYDRAAAERENRAIRDAFDAAWFARALPVSTRPLLFVCGMLRSGTTLLEQMLGAHPALTPGGEIAYLNARLDGDSLRFPSSAVSASAQALHALGQGYLDHLAQRFPDAGRVINKRPDTFRYLGLLHGLFPEARFIVMRRDPLDTSIAIFGQQLADPLNFATDLEDIAHYELGFRDLLAHWRALFPERIIEVQYERLVSEPESELERVCAFLDLPWDADMLRFTAYRGRVRTASVWQVRQPVHTRSIGRWRQYAPHLGAIVKMLGAEHDSDGQ